MDLYTVYTLLSIIYTKWFIIHCVNSLGVKIVSVNKVSVTSVSISSVIVNSVSINFVLGIPYVRTGPPEFMEDLFL